MNQIKFSQKNLKPLFKYPGGKSSEYKYLRPFFPNFKVFVEPFVGGGAVYWATDAEKLIVNDASKELISIYKYTQKQSVWFIRYLEDIGSLWENKKIVVEDIKNVLIRESFLIDEEKIILMSKKVLGVLKWIDVNLDIFSSLLIDCINRKKNSLKKISKTKKISNFEENAFGTIGSAVYMYLRGVYNSISYNENSYLKTSLYFFLREYSYSSMFRFNSLGEFNVPFGGNSYAKKSFITRINQVTSLEVIDKLKRTQIKCGDFSEAMPDEEDTFIFLDPPYDSEFSTYNLKIFGNKDQLRLRDKLLSLENSKWLMVIKSTEFIEEIYDRNLFIKNRFDKSYSVNFKNRNKRNVEHMIVTNYELQEV